MKKITLLLLMLISGTVFGQTTATAKADATIITALKIASTANLNFGTIAPEADVATTFSVSNAGVVGGDATDMVAGDHTVASFTITGDSSQSIDLTITPPTNLTGTGDPIPFTMDSSLTNGSHSLTGGTLTLKVGGQLDLGANQTAGAYTGDIEVTVAYE